MAKAGVLFVGTASGCEVWSDPGGSGRWRRRLTAFEGVSVSRVSAQSALDVAACADQQWFSSNDGGVTWRSADYAAPATLPEPTLTLLGEPFSQLRVTDAGVERLDSDGGSWQPVLNAQVSLLHAVPYHRDQVWAGAADGRLWLSDDRGRSWQAIGTTGAAVLALAAVRLH